MRELVWVVSNGVVLGVERVGWADWFPIVISLLREWVVVWRVGKVGRVVVERVVGWMVEWVVGWVVWRNVWLVVGRLVGVVVEVVLADRGWHG